MTYFDHNATTPVLPEARSAWLECTEKYVGNPSSRHRLGARADSALTSAREKLAAFLSCDPLDIFWTSGATESNNTVLHHYSRISGKEDEVWVSAIEHPCVLQSTRYYFPKRHCLIPVTASGVIDLNWLRAHLKERRPALIVCMAANNETGVLQPWQQVLALCRDFELPYFCDAAQWVGKLPALGLGECDFVSGCAHKFGGPKGVGFLKCPGGGKVYPLLLGGMQEEGRRAGTENVAGVVSMLAALEFREAALGSGQHKLRLSYRENFEQDLLQRLPGTIIVGKDEHRLWNTISAIMPQSDYQQRWVVKLDKLGFAVSTGSACASGREEPSHVLAAMGSDDAQTGRVLRFSSGWETPQEDWVALLEALVKVYRGMTKVS